MNQRKKILIVDDASFMRTAVSHMLDEFYDTVSAASGEEAVALYDAEKPDLILTDLIMPGMSGLELRQKLQETHEDLAPVIFMSADENEETEIAGLESGADFIRKPFKKPVLLRRVGNIIGQVDKIRDLRRVAQTDPMTGLFNKAHVHEMLKSVCASQSGTLMMVDLDSFKPVNDIYGHAMGDRVLIRFADILRSAFRSGDIIGRVGGDEFIVFCQDIREENVIREKTALINRLLVESAIEFMGESMSIPIGVSVGAVTAPDEGTDFHKLSEKADQALYRVKKNGKHDCAFFHSETRSYNQEPRKTPPAVTLKNIRTVLDERNRDKGAYELGYEAFRSIYRFLSRSIENYHRPVELFLFTLPANAHPYDVDRFGEVLRMSLRRSDVYTRNGRHQYLAILPEILEENLDVILTRILKNWNDMEEGDAPEISWESEAMTQ